MKRIDISKYYTGYNLTFGLDQESGLEQSQQVLMSSWDQKSIHDYSMDLPANHTLIAASIKRKNLLNEFDDEMVMLTSDGKSLMFYLAPLSADNNTLPDHTTWSSAKVFENDTSENVSLSCRSLDYAQDTKSVIIDCIDKTDPNQIAFLSASVSITDPLAIQVEWSVTMPKYIAYNEDMFTVLRLDQFGEPMQFMLRFIPFQFLGPKNHNDSWIEVWQIVDEMPTQCY